jgi:hypothetical protein
MKTYDDEPSHLRLVGGIDHEKNKLGIPEQHRGLLFTRVLEGHHPQDNTRLLEAGFAEEWSKLNKDSRILESLLSAYEDDPRRKSAPKTEREWEVAHLVAATLVQWLPTSVGCCFLRTAFQEGGGDLKYRLPDWKEFSSY